MKIIFLDIDGVLNHELWLNSGHKERILLQIEESKKPTELANLDPEKIALINTLIEDTDAKVVITSTWRLGTSVAYLQEIFNLAGFKGEILDFTPDLKLAYAYGVGQVALRGNEIHCWMQNNEALLNMKTEDFKQYVIIDDEDDMLLWHKDNFIKTDSVTGLTMKLLKQASRILC